MSADIVNLRQARRAKARKDREQQAAEHRAKFGQPKSARLMAVADRSRSDNRLDGVRREAPQRDAVPDDKDSGTVS